MFGSIKRKYNRICWTYFQRISKKQSIIIIEINLVAIAIISRGIAAIINLKILIRATRKIKRIGDFEITVWIINSLAISEVEKYWIIICRVAGID